MRSLRPALLLAALFVSAPAPALAQWVPDGIPVASLSGIQEDPAVAPDGAGGAFVAWTDRRATPSRVYLTRITSSGARHADWPVNGRPVVTRSSVQRAPTLVADGAGGVLVAWQDSRFDVNGDLFVTRLTGQGLRAPGWADSGTVLCAQPGYQDPPLGVSDGASGAYFAWQDGRGEMPSIGCTRIGGDGSFPSGWPAIPQTLTADGFAPALCADGAGGAIVVWQDGTQVFTTDFDIHGVRFAANGTRVWGATDGTVVCDDPVEQSTPAVTSDAAGAALVAWVDARDGDMNLYGQKIDGTGARAWASAGVALINDPNDQGPPRMIGDALGGAILAFEDARPPVNVSPEIYGQHVTGSGAPAATWTTAGKLFASGAFAQQLGGMIPDGSGGALLAWTDFRSAGVRDIYAVRMNGLGSTVAGWTVGGSPVCTAPNSQYAVVLCDDNAGGAILAWVDERGASPDIYAQRVTASGVAGPTVGVAPAPGTAPAIALSGVVPLPARGSMRARLSLAFAGPVDAFVADAAGRRMRTLLTAAALPAGSRDLSWDGTDERGSRVAPGIYFLVARAGGARATTRAVLLAP